ncbi:auxilin-like protein 1 [Daucus carota subsp. sativus]|uniref:J domain-containing protein n=1 Tax=Daucus carota subsp. sativus TaxID=79200 RepID=A0A164VD20_DAUCS|nr:PREDICTED: auxilin-like protein 1 [Daucus carota subsp. sativus]
MQAPTKQEDYNEIFRSSSGSSIPILELSDTDGSVNLRSSEINYKDVFSGCSEDTQAIGVSYQDLLSANVRTRSASEVPLKKLDCPTFPKENQLLCAEDSSLNFDDKKNFNMSYNKTSAGSQDRSNGTIHVAQFHPEPGFTTFVDDSSPQESKFEKPDPSVTSDIRPKLDFSDRKPEKAIQHIDTQRSSRREVNSRNKFQQDGSISNNKLLNKDVDDLRQRLPPLVEKNNSNILKRSTVSNSEDPEGIAYEHATGDDSQSFFSEELHLNSTSAIAAAALKDAIQKAQKIIEIAKKLMERKKSGLHSRSNQVFEDFFRVEVRKQNPIAHEEKRIDNINAKDTCDYVDSLLNAFSWRWKNAFRHGQDDLYFRTSTSAKVTNAQNHATNVKREPAVSTASNIWNNRAALPEQQVIMNKHEYDAREGNLTREALMKQEINVEKEEDNEKAYESVFIKQKEHAVVMDSELESSANKLAKDVGVDYSLVSQEDGDCGKIQHEQNIKDELKFKFVLLENSDYEKMTCKTQNQDHNKPKVNFQQHSEKATENIKEEPEHRPKTICDEGLEEKFEDAFEWVPNEDELNDSLGSASNENEKETYMAEVIWGERRLAELNKMTIEEKRSTDFNGHKKIEEAYGKSELGGSGNGYGSCNQYEKTETKQTGTKRLEALQQFEYECTVNRERDPLSREARDNIIETQKPFQPFMFDESLKAEQVNDNIRSIDTAAKEFCDFREGKAEEAKVIYKVHKLEDFETVGLVQGATEENEDKKMKNVFEVISSEGSIPGFGLTDSDLEHKEDEQRNKDFKSNINPDNGAQISVIVSAEKENVFKEAKINRDEKAVKNSPDISNGERDVVILKNFEASSGSVVSSEIEKVIQVDEEMTDRHNTHVNGDSCKTIEEKEACTKPENEMETEIVVEVAVDNAKEEVAMKGTKTGKVVSKGVEGYECLKKNHEESKRERQRGKDRIAVETAIQEARARVVAGARERAERAAVERATAEVRQRMMAEARGKFEKATTTAKPLAEKTLLDAKLRSERAAVDRATAEARARALEKALSKKPTATEDIRKSDKACIESALRSKARLEREERVMERAAKALAEKNMRDLLAQKEEAEKNRLAESLDAEIKRWSTGKEGNLRALLSTLQYILGPGSGWQPISLTDIIMSNAVKKAYRKATLHVHPDKLQQRGASIREKYICEKVFDLLKVAWNRFSSEER